MDDNTNNKQPQRVSRSFLFSILLVAAVIAIIAFSIFSNMNTTRELGPDKFVDMLYNGNITEVQPISASTTVTLEGRYEEDDSTGKPVKGTYSVTFERSMYEQKLLWNVDLDEDGTANDEASIIDIIRYAENKYGDKFLLRDTIDPYQSSWWDEWGPFILIVGSSILLTLFLFSRMSSSVNGANKQAMDFNRSRARRVNTGKVKFDDVAGADEEKAEMREIVDYLKDPKKFTKLGAKLPKGVLLVGPPGCGKTLLAKAVAGEADVPFYSISGSDFVEMFVGVGAGRVRDMFRIAKENAPCLIFIDEIDAVGRQRGAGLGGGNDEREQTLNQLLVEMDGFNDNAGIIVIAATNRDDVLDPALLRAGRFDRKITVSLPDRRGREAIFKVHSRGKKIDKDISFENISRRTVGFSGADIENIMNEAAILAIRAGREVVTVDDIDEAIDRRVAGPAKSSRSISEHEKKLIAYHEAGHAIIGLKYPHSDIVQKITIIPRGNTGGHVRMTPEEDRFLLTKKELEARIVGFLGGRSSEETFFDDISSGAQNDIEVATQIARIMVCELGMSTLGPIQYEKDTSSVFLGRDYTSSQRSFSSETALKIDNEVRNIIDKAHQESLRVIKEHREDVELLAKTLIEFEQITAEEIDYLLKNRRLKREEKATTIVVEETPAKTVEVQKPAGEEI